MAKELGQIHTVNNQFVFNGSGDITNIDLPGELTSQLQRMIRQGNFFKVVGIDMSLSTVGTVGGGQVTGEIRYYAPTRGRCEAYRGAFKAMREAMKLQGITNAANNRLYDFRVKINDNTSAGTPVSFPNQATLDGTNGLCLHNVTVGDASVFDVHNRMVRPIQSLATPAGDIFAPGFNTMGVQATPTDFVLNDELPFTGSPDSADVTVETIPFMLSWTPDTTDMAVAFQWRPDPALYLAVMCGQLQVHVEEVNLDGSPQAPALELNIAVMTSGWKSIMGSPDKKRRSRKSSSSKKASKMTKTTTTVVKK